VRFPCVHAAATTPVQRLGAVFARAPNRVSLPRFHVRIGLHIVLFEACSAFTRVAACTLARSPYVVTAIRRLQTPRLLHVCSGRFRLERSPGGACTHWKTPPCHGARRVGMWRGGVRSTMSVAAPFVWRCLSGSAITPFPHPAHRTQQADFPHCALGQDLTPSPTTGRGRAGSDVRARSTRRGARVDSSRACVACPCA
jgi:hypothetical protein